MKHRLVRPSCWLRAIMATAGVLSFSMALAAPVPQQGNLATRGLRQLSATDLNIRSGKGRAFLVSLFGNPEKRCAPVEEGHLPFDRLCLWSATDADNDFDMMIGIRDDHIVSVVTPRPDLPPALWACTETLDGPPQDDAIDLKTCSLRSFDKATRDHWAAGWRASLNSMG